MKDERALLRIALVGAAGRMGQAICALAESENVEVVGRVNANDAVAGHGADVLIDFSSPAAAPDVCTAALSTSVPMVIGTTGHSAEQRDCIEKAAKNVPVVFASNFSVGVNLLFSLAERAAGILGDGFDIEIVEAHHRLKKDAPSGTANTLLEVIDRARGANEARQGGEGMTGQRPKNKVGVHSIRGGDLVGDHTVIFAGAGERLELTHRASSRETFARGALRAARWVMGRPAALYSMRDVLGL